MGPSWRMLPRPKPPSDSKLRHVSGLRSLSPSALWGLNQWTHITWSSAKWSALNVTYHCCSHMTSSHPPLMPPLLRPLRPPKLQSQKTFFNIYPSWPDPSQHLKTDSLLLELCTHTTQPCKPGPNSPPRPQKPHCSGGGQADTFSQMMKPCWVLEDIP